MTPRQRRYGTAAFIGTVALLWAGGISYGAVKIFEFETTAGALGNTPEAWPMQSALRRAPANATAVMLVHPECSCTSASLAELAEIVRRTQARVTFWVLFEQSEGSPTTANWISAQRIPGVHIEFDPNGTEARRFGALTSGFIVLYDRNGRLMFSGGITGARGHAGRNVGRDELLDALARSAAPAAKHPVYGCPLLRQTAS